MAGSESLYEMLGVEKTASQAEIKKAYYRLALQWHPDRNSYADAKEKFQALQRVYDVLSDPEKRKVYDRTGSLQDCEEMMQSDNFQELYNAFRAAVKVTEEDVDTFAVQYRGSAEERADLLRHYVEFKGDMERVFDWLMLSRPDMDSHRFRDTLEQAMTAGEVKSTKKYKAWSQKVAVTPKPTADPLAPPPKRKSNGKQTADDSMALVAAIKSKEKAFSGMLASLEAKYSKSDSSKGKGSVKASKTSKKAAAAERSDTEERSGDENAAEPTEEEFQAARARIEQRQQQAAGKGRQGQQTRKQEAGSSKKAKKQRKA